MIKTIQNIYQLFFPSICLNCAEKTNNESAQICSSCSIDLRKCQFYKNPEDNALEKLFWGRCKIKNAYTAFQYSKGNAIANMVQGLKYKNKPELGIQMGAMMLDEIQQYPNFEIPDVLVPMPLHPKKKYKRGYNQSMKICEGIAEKIPIDISQQILKRKVHNVTQTKKHQFERWDNVSSIFQATTDDTYNHVMIVDDVVTTGATLEAAAQTLIDKDYQVSIATFAMTTHR